MILARVKIPTSFVSETIREIGAEAVADAPTIFGIGLDTALGVVSGGGAVAAGIGAWKLAKVLFRKDRETTSEPEVKTQLDDPFPRRLDEALQHRKLRQFNERRCPEFDAAVGRIVADELATYKQLGDDTDRTVLAGFWGRVRNRVDTLMPPSTREYITTERK